MYYSVFSLTVAYDRGQQIILGGSSSSPAINPTHADVMAAFPTWQGQVALFVPQRYVTV